MARRRKPSSYELRVASLFDFEEFKRVFGHPSVDFERTVTLPYQSALLLACNSPEATIAKVRWLVDQGASVCALLEHVDASGTWRGYVARWGVERVAPLERLLRKHCAMVVRLIGLKTDVPLLPLALEQEVASFLV